MIKEQLNARYLLCPIPVIRVQDRIKKLHPGDILEVFCTDPGTQQDIPTWCRINGHQVIDCNNDEEEYTFTLKVGE